MPPATLRSDAVSDPPVRVVVGCDRSAAHALSEGLSDPSRAVAVAALGRCADDVVALVLRERPAVVLLDGALPGGVLLAVEQIMSRAATPIVVCGAPAEPAADLLAAGAVDVVADLPADLHRRVLLASRVRVITHPRGRLRERGWAVAPGAAPGRPTAPRLVVIGASTGGPAALATILRALPDDFEVPVLVVQHMADGFVDGLAAWLDTQCGLAVGVAVDGSRLLPGTVLLAPAACDLVVDGDLVARIADPAPGQFHAPSIDVTLRSVAAACGPRVLGVLLTGMGRDGAAGLQALRERGAPTLAQDEATSAVWGMPAAARALGAVGTEVALPGMAAAIVSAVRGAA